VQPGRCSRRVAPCFSVKMFQTSKWLRDAR
jgi:hypothetical protein